MKEDKIKKEVKEFKAKAKPKNICGDCKFFAGNSVGSGRCLRYPNATPKKAGDWCGEHS